jgi:hypothetical protein
MHCSYSLYCTLISSLLAHLHRMLVAFWLAFIIDACPGRLQRSRGTSLSLPLCVFSFFELLYNIRLGNIPAR